MLQRGASGDPRWILSAATAIALWWAQVAASAAQELPTGGGPVPPLRRGAHGQIEIAPPDSVPRPGADKHTMAPAAGAPKPSPSRTGPGGSTRAVRDTRPPQPVIMVTPNAPRVRDTAPLGSVVASYSVRMSDGSPFTGTVRFGPPYYDSKGVFALSGNDIVVNPNGPGIGPNKTTITDHITLETVP
jgi:hypothetical protein